jgi:hypothetical protein
VGLSLVPLRDNVLYFVIDNANRKPEMNKISKNDLTMTLGTAADMVARADKFDANQLARARVVVAYWTALRAKQARAKAAKAAK